MKAGLAALALSYILSQFFRSYLAVLAPALEADIGAMPDDLSRASSVFFLTFAAAQIGVGWSLDRFGPRLTAALPFGLFGAGGALVVALATSPMAIITGMGLIGIGVSPILMAAYFIFLRSYSAAAFATLAGLFLGFGSLGNLIGTVPLAAAVTTIGWRTAMLIVAGLALTGALGIAAFARDPERGEAKAATGGYLSLLALRPLWPLFAMTLVCYAPSISLRGVWVGPYLKDTFGLDTAAIGWASMGMALSSILALVCLGPLDRWLGRTKLLAAMLGGVTTVAVLALATAPPLPLAIALFIAIGFFGSMYPIVIAHGMSLVPKDLTGRGTSLLNLFNIGGVALLQWLSAFSFASGSHTYPPVFLATAGFLALGLVVYVTAAQPKASAKAI